MLKITKRDTNRLDIELSGKLDSEQMRKALDELVEKMRDIEKGTLLYDVVDFQMPSAGALRIEIARLPQMFRLMKKIKRAAVLTDKRWLKKASELEGMLIPGLEVKAFDRDKRAEAEAWLAR
jgi:hypothetical protein